VIPTERFASHCLTALSELRCLVIHRMNTVTVHRAHGTLPFPAFVMMNPSTDDPTVAKCSCFARAWNYGGLHVSNTFAYRAADQKRLLAVDDPIRPRQR
jgi:hypothetical protein